MKITFSKRFTKELEKAPQNIQKIFRDKLFLFIDNKQHILLRNHKLQGVLTEYRSININGDWRVLFRELDDNEIFFDIIGTHSQLYS